METTFGSYLQIWFSDAFRQAISYFGFDMKTLFVAAILLFIGLYKYFKKHGLQRTKVHIIELAADTGQPLILFLILMFLWNLVAVSHSSYINKEREIKNLKTSITEQGQTITEKDQTINALKKQLAEKELLNRPNLVVDYSRFEKKKNTEIAIYLKNLGNIDASFYAFVTVFINDKRINKVNNKNYKGILVPGMRRKISIPIDNKRFDEEIMSNKSTFKISVDILYKDNFNIYRYEYGARYNHEVDEMSVFLESSEKIGSRSD
jgi:hypothetical protein